MRAIFTFILLFSTSASAVIFGLDDRIEIYQSPLLHKEIAPAIAMSMGASYLLPQPSSPLFGLDFPLASVSYNYDLCSTEKFASQEANWLNCTGFMVTEDILVTAGHCMVFSHGTAPEFVVNEQTPMCVDFAWIFDYETNPSGLINVTEVDPERIFRCGNVLYSQLSGSNFDRNGRNLPLPNASEYGIDFAIVKLDRPVIGRAPLKLSTDVPAKGQPVKTIGYPMGLPMKVAGNATILETKYKNYFTTDLDVIGGNSGGPVLNAKNEVIGIVVRAFPGEDFVLDPVEKCQRMLVCKDLGKGDCASTNRSATVGSHIQRLDPVIAKLKELQIL